MAESAVVRVVLIRSLVFLSSFVTEVLRRVITVSVSAIEGALTVAVTEVGVVFSSLVVLSGLVAPEVGSVAVPAIVGTVVSVLSVKSIFLFNSGLVVLGALGSSLVAPVVVRSITVVAPISSIAVVGRVTIAIIVISSIGVFRSPVVAGDGVAVLIRVVRVMGVGVMRS
jgi:hypothetical protein